MIFAIAINSQLYQRPFEDQLESRQLSHPYQSLLEFYHSNKKGKNSKHAFFENQINKCIKGFPNLGKYLFDCE